MVLFNYTTREITAKIVYYGPGLGGKTTNLQSIYDDLPDEMKGKMLSLATKSDRTLFFDFLPIDLGSIGGMKVRVQLYTVPGQVYYNSTRKLVLKGADGVVFVADSQDAMEEANRESLDNLYQNLAEQNVKIDDICMALQYNKRDLASVMPVEQMTEKLNRGGWPVFEAVATQGIGVQETLREMLKLVVLSLKEKYDFNVGESSLLEELDQAGEALKGATASVEPPHTVVEETPPVTSAITEPLSSPEPTAPEPVHALSVEAPSGESGAGAQARTEGIGVAEEPELELFELDDEFLDTGDEEEPLFKGGTVETAADDTVLIVDEQDDGSGPGSAPVADDAAVPVRQAADDAEAEPETATLHLVVPDTPGTDGAVEATVPVNVRIEREGAPVDLRFTLTLRFER
jgi:signal recognition particle receptor subunit beta